VVVDYEGVGYTMMKLHYKDVVANYEDKMVHYIDVVVQSKDMVLTGFNYET
jgi:hypothetical protein